MIENTILLGTKKLNKENLNLRKKLSIFYVKN